jgi:hypothetical protein
MPSRVDTGVPLAAPLTASDLMLATLHKRPFSDRDWLFELKYKLAPNPALLFKRLPSKAASKWCCF